MPPDGQPPGSPYAWLEFARSDLVLARTWTSGVLLELLCFHAQQAAEKAIKAVLLERGIRFPYTHDLKVLIGLLRANDIAWSADLDRTSRLAGYATAGRYPGTEERVTEEEYLEALRFAGAVLDWANRVLGT